MSDSEKNEHHFKIVMANPNRIQSKYFKQYKSIMMMKPSKAVTGISLLKMKKRMFEMNKVEALMRLKQVKRIDHINSLLKVHANPPSFKFYESFDILLHKKIGDIREIIN